MKRTARQIGFAICILLAVFLTYCLWHRSHHTVPLDGREPRTVADNAHLQEMHRPDPSVPRADTDTRLDGAPIADEVVGVGAAIHIDRQSGAVRIMNVVPNSPASQAGLSAGLMIQKIDDVLTTGMRLRECVERIRGPVGTKVRLELIDLDRDETNTVELTRQKLQL